MYDVTEYCLSYTVLVSVVQSGAVVTRSSLSQIYTQHCTDSSRTEFILEKHNRHQIPRPKGRDMGCLLWEFEKKLTVLWRCRTVLIHFQSLLGHCYGSLSYDVTSVLMQSCLRTSESDVLCLYVLLCLVVTKKCKYGEIKLCGRKTNISWEKWTRCNETVQC